MISRSSSQQIMTFCFISIITSTKCGIFFQKNVQEIDQYLDNNRNTDDKDQQQLKCDCSCGLANEGQRVVGGTPTDPNEFPWMVRLSYFNRFYCGGTLINDKYVLTAAHCVKGFVWFLIKVTLGEYDRCGNTNNNNNNKKPESRFVLRVFAGNFSFFNFNNDIALIRLNDRVPITDTIRPICLPTNTEDLYVDRTATVAGWGTLEENGKPACIVRHVDVPIITNAKCAAQYEINSVITQDMMCAGYDEGGKDSCQGDSGGPLMNRREDGRYELIGVVSWGNGCARPHYPGVYTRVNKYESWIKGHTKDGCYCTD